ncbi:MAG: hypothetical protein BGN87_22600 [Rhizobiales bacterium 65-79]|jgi:predicted RecA/RadA family phage recombinase|nr:DUF2190 family protein [Hyphomicrobiales bacterium]OJU00114.1 MAG: hypothetical protein BGN87_22600 [Rhizobiales bacterium 65-79]
MATNFVEPGSTITIPATAAASGGDLVFAGSIFGIAAGDAAIGDSLDLELGKVWDLPKPSVDVVTVGAPIYWDAENKLATIDDDDSGNAKIGVAVAAAANGGATVRVRLNSSF